MQTFFDSHLDTLLSEKFFARRYSVPELQHRYDLLTQKIQERYGKTVRQNPLGEYFPLSKRQALLVHIENGEPTVTLFIPSCMDLYEDRRRMGLTEGEFELEFAIDYLHELDHLAHGYIPKEGESLAPLAWIENEKRAWAETCQHVLEPILVTHRMKVPPRHAALYKEWILSGRNADSPSWHSYIAGLYSPLLSK